MRRFALVWLWLASTLVAQETKQEAKLEISKEEYKQRRTTLAGKVGPGVTLIECQKLSGEIPCGDDSQTANFDFVYLTGLQEPGAVLVLAEGKSILFSADPKAKEKTGMDHVLAPDKLGEFLNDVVKGGPRVHLWGRSLDAKLKELGIKWVGDVAQHVNTMRGIKSKAEVALTRHSIEISCKAHVKAMKAIKPGMNEKEIQRIYEEAYKAEHATPGYGYICGAGIHGCTLHYMSNDGEIPDATLIVSDCGSCYKGYVADITRTFPTNGTFTKEQREVYQTVLDAQKAAEKILKPGVTWQELHAAAAGVIKDRGLTDWSYAHSKDRQVRHGLGHHVGLGVHDSGSYGKLEEGMIITIEPGIYDKDQKFGVRIEDMYLVTKDGCERLSTAAPREIDEIEKLMKKE